MIKYIGSKRLLVPRILELVAGIDGVSSVCDLFSGTSRVGIALKQAGYFVHANDSLAYAHALAHTFVQVDGPTFPLQELEQAIDRLNALDGEEGYFTRKFAIEARFFQPHNAARIDAIRKAIDKESCELEPVLLTALMLAADRVDSTVGVQMAYLKDWADRAYQRLHLRPPDLYAGAGLATQADALDIAASIDADLVYLDPPYNQHSYLGNYHIWESLVLNDDSETYGKANKRLDCRTRPSPFNLKAEARQALEHVLFSLKSRRLILSFNDEGFVSLSELEAMLTRWGSFTRLDVPHRRHVGSRIGIYNLRGEKVGSPSHHGNHEFLFRAERRRG